MTVALVRRRSMSAQVKNIDTPLEWDANISAPFAAGRYPLRGNGYLAGEFPDGITTVEGVPVSATVRILYRPAAGAPGDGVVVAEVQSAPDGSWMVEGLNPDLRYDVVGRLQGRNDVIMTNVKPMRTDIVTYEGELVPNEEFDGMEGHILLLDGMPPFIIQNVSDVPPGLSPVIIDGRKLIIDGTTSAGGEWDAGLTIEDSNGNTTTIPVVIPIGLEAPSDLDGIFNGAAGEVSLTWISNSYIEQSFLIYRSDEHIDPEALPPPIGSVEEGVTEFVDDGVEEDAIYYYRVAAVRGDSIRVSDQFIITTKYMPTVIGEPFGGGYYAGDITVDEGGADDGVYALIMADSEAVEIRSWAHNTGLRPASNSRVNGVANTHIIASYGDVEQFFAAKHCIDHRGGGNEDWYLPAIDELFVAYENRADLSITGIDFNNIYWSSTRGGGSTSSLGIYLRFSVEPAELSRSINQAHRVIPFRRVLKG